MSLAHVSLALQRAGRAASVRFRVTTRQYQTPSNANGAMRRVCAPQLRLVWLALVIRTFTLLVQDVVPHSDTQVAAIELWSHILTRKEQYSLSADDVAVTTDDLGMLVLRLTLDRTVSELFESGGDIGHSFYSDRSFHLVARLYSLDLDCANVVAGHTHAERHRREVSVHIHDLRVVAEGRTRNGHLEANDCLFEDLGRGRPGTRRNFTTQQG
ncbi:hypothetical protein EXIGLDRAFT_397305 [Exidia glandulosa HHB12029]|uniref:Uncharacterized protein n=1 Tax=Exidia glandulosa HHB12029 TaxID=1314781 RepID=A0A165KVY9_EXIGL|nr:hypothetical protein EXIGLDRAFT_397305 [Exidia glandulosa HHB12029]